MSDDMLNDFKDLSILKNTLTGVCVEATEQSFSCKLGVGSSVEIRLHTAKSQKMVIEAQVMTEAIVN